MQIEIESKIRNYRLIFAENDSYFERLAGCKPRVVIVDANVYRLYKPLFDRWFTGEEIICFDAVEANKNIEGVLALCDRVMAFAAKKNLTILSFGGGIVQDVTGFLASVLYRGVNWVFVPTTLLAQADSCMGSKTSLNHRHFKNLLGTFYPPSEVWIDSRFVETLSETDFYSGIGEIVKLHLMGGRDAAEGIADEIARIAAGDRSRLSELVQRSLEIKYSYIKDDEFDTGRRNLLNYGHCFGHAFESASDYAVPHGIAVVAGILFAELVAVRRGLRSAERVRRNTELLLPCLRSPLKADYFDRERILAAMKMDKKRVGEGLPLIIADDAYGMRKLTDMTPEELFAGVEEMRRILEIRTGYED